MENYNGQNQSPYSQNQCDYNQQNMYSVSGYLDGYINPAKIKSKKKSLKWLCIIGAASVVIIATVFLIIVMFGSSYDVNDFNKVSKLCREVFNVELVENPQYYSETLNEDVQTIAEGMRGVYYSEVGIKVTWTKYFSEESAKTSYEELVGSYERSYQNEIRGSAMGNWHSDRKKTEYCMWWITEECIKRIFIREDEYVLSVFMRGNRDDIERLSEQFIKGIES